MTWHELAGTLFPSSRSSLAILVHDQSSEQFAGGKFNRLAFLLVGDGYDVLTFDLIGFGQNARQIVTPRTMQEDVTAAVEDAQRCGYKRIALFADGSAATVCARVAADIQAIVMMSPGRIFSDQPWYFEESDINELREEGTVTIRGVHGSKAPVIYGVEMLDDHGAGEADIAARLAAIRCPTLMVQAQNYTEEEQLVLMRRYVAGLPSGSDIAMVPNADPRFSGYAMDKLMKAVRPLASNAFPSQVSHGR